MFWLAPSSILTKPELVPALVLNVISPVPLVVTITSSPEAPILTVSVLRLTSPVPWGMMSMFLLSVVTRSYVCKSKSPPNVGVESAWTSVNPVWLNSCMCKISPLLAPEARTTEVPVVAV